MKWLIKLVFLVATIGLAFTACSSDDEDDPDEWVKAADFEGLPRSGAVGFTIGDYTYLTTGYGTNSNRFVDTWRFNPALQSWDQMSDFPGEARNNAIAFVLNGKGYVGLGTNSTTMFKDFYEYDPATDTWTKIADFVGAARYGAVGFTLNGVAYVGTGRDFDGQDYNDIYTFTPNSTGGTWTKVTSTPNKRSFSFAFVLNNIAYLGGGTSNNQNVKTFYAFDGTTWTEKEPLAERDDDDYTYDLTRLSPSAFVLNGTAFISGGLSSYSGSPVSSTWRYVSSGDYWEEHQTFGGSSRHQAITFVHGDYAYVATGRSGTSPFYDMWTFSPNPW
ncbi:Kelch repeat-containing protein [Sphingobacterium suaedae]|uniref:Kelch repeat-containing protein n=1 Tax=Sphingobacterium suaedae TaxID=1686402 RepID=A0ABW5KFV3_9SPHI